MRAKRPLRFFEHIVGTNPSEEIISFVNFKGKTIKHRDTCFPSIFVPFQFFNPQRWMLNVFYKKPNLFLKGFLDMMWEFLIVLLKGVRSDYFHAFRSVMSSSTDENSLTLPDAISESASFSAISQSKSLKYGGSVNAYLISSYIADCSSGRRDSSLNFITLSNILFGNSKTTFLPIFSPPLLVNTNTGYGFISIIEGYKDGI